jgi:hypothetical protein
MLEQIPLILEHIPHERNSSHIQFG